MGQHGYAVTNMLTGLGVGSYTWSNAFTTDRDKLADGRMDTRENIGNVATGVNLVINLGSAQAVEGFAVLNSNVAVQKPGATLQIKGADDAGITVNPVTAKAASTLYSSTSPKNKDHVLQFPAVTKQYWQLQWAWGGGGNVTGFSIGEIFAFPALSLLSRRSVYGSGEMQEMIVSQVQMQYGETRALFQAGPIRQLDLEWADLTASQRDELQTMWATSYGGASPLLWVFSFESQSGAAAASEQECIFGRLVKPAFGWKETDFALFQPDGFSLRSLGREAGS